MQLSFVDQLIRLAAHALELEIVEDVWIEGDVCWLREVDTTYSCSIAEAIATLGHMVADEAVRRARRVLAS